MGRAARLLAGGLCVGGGGGWGSAGGLQRKCWVVGGRRRLYELSWRTRNFSWRTRSASGGALGALGQAPSSIPFGLGRPCSTIMQRATFLACRGTALARRPPPSARVLVQVSLRLGLLHRSRPPSVRGGLSGQRPARSAGRQIKEKTHASDYWGILRGFEEISAGLVRDLRRPAAIPGRPKAKSAEAGGAAGSPRFAGAGRPRAETHGAEIGRP